MKKVREQIKFDAGELVSEILSEAKSLRIPAETAKVIAKRVVDEVTKWASGRTAVTEMELDRQVVKNLEKYNHDLAYVYQNRGKII